MTSFWAFNQLMRSVALCGRYNVLTQRGISHVLICGVHLNMCVLGRGVGIRQLIKLGFTVRLVRDLTDTMYNPTAAPRVDHFTATELVVRHVERHWCATILSTDVTGEPAFRFHDAPPPPVHPPIVRVGDMAVSTVALGCFAFGGDRETGGHLGPEMAKLHAGVWGPQEDADTYATVWAALDRGVNFFDTAEMYGVCPRPPPPE